MNNIYIENFFLNKLARWVYNGLMLKSFTILAVRALLDIKSSAKPCVSISDKTLLVLIYSGPTEARREGEGGMGEFLKECCSVSL